MVFAWAIAFPVGVLAARYFKIMPGQAWPEELDNKTWWHCHRVLQGTGVIVMTVGCLLALGHSHGANGLAQFHRWMGWGLVASGWCQILGGVLRGTKGGGNAAAERGSAAEMDTRGDHYDMTGRRKAFEYVHKLLGWSALLVAVIVIAFGLVLADAPRWMAIILAVWWCLLIALGVRWQRAGRCVDTYQAIWGPDRVHPGNRIPPIGWGIRRYSRTSWQGRSGNVSAREN